MDNADPTPAERRPTLTFGPDRRLALLALAVAAIFVGLVVVTADAPGRLLYGLAALVAAGLGTADLAVNPRLLLDTDGVAVRRGFSWHRTAWADVDSIVLDETTRRGLSSRNLEIDDGMNLVVLGRHALGTDAREVKALLDAFRAGQPGSGD